jgi:hypothetical protein
VARKSTDLVVNILGDYDSLKKTLRKASGDVDKFDKNLKQAGKSTGLRNIGKAALGAAAGLGAVTIAANEIKKSVTGTVELAKATRQLQRATGLASEDASRLASVLKVRGLSTDKVGRSFTTLARQIEAAKTGTGSAAEAFTKLGVSQKAIQSGNFNQVLLGIADGFGKLGDGTAKASTAQQLFGRNSRDLLPLLEGGSQKLREQLALAPALSDAQVKQSLAMVNAQRQVDLALMNVRTTLGTTLMPVLADGANKLAKFVTEMKTGKGAGGEFAKKAKEIFNAIKPALEKLVDFGKAVFNFAANNPEVVKIAANLAAVGLAIKAIKFGSSISGLSTFIKTAKGLGGPLKKVFERFGTRAGTAFAGEAAAGMAGSEGLGGALSPGGKVGKMGKDGGKFDKWGRRMGKAAVFGFVAGFVALFGDELSRAISKKLGEMGLPKLLQDHFLGFFGADAQAPTVNPNSKAYKDWERRNAPRRRTGARGSSIMGRAGRNLRPTLNAPGFGVGGFGADPFTGGIPVEVLLKRAEGQASRARNTFDRATVRAGDSRTKAETKRLRELEAAAKLAEKRVKSLQSQLSRRDALMEIRSQFKDFTRGFTDAYSQGLENIAQARLQAAQTLAQQTLDANLKNLDEEEGQSAEAQRLRELRAQQERDQKEREDKDYSENKKLLEDELARAIRNGNVRRQEELNQSIEDLDTQRRDTLRAREITELSESLARQRTAAQREYEEKSSAAQAYYDEQKQRNLDAVEAYQKSLDDQMAALTRQLEAGTISYTEFNRQVTVKYGELTANFNTELTNRATAESTALAASLGATGTYVTQVNAEFARVMRSFPVPEIPPIPTISIDAVLNIQKINGLPSEVTIPGGGEASKPQYQGMTPARIKTFLKTLRRGQTYGAGELANLSPFEPVMFKKYLSYAAGKKLLQQAGIKIDYNRVSGGRLSRSGLTMVGETGPELVMNGQVYSGTRTARMSGSGVTLNVYPQTTADDPVALARALGWQLATR